MGLQGMGYIRSQALEIRVVESNGRLLKWWDRYLLLPDSFLLLATGYNRTKT